MSYQQIQIVKDEMKKQFNIDFNTVKDFGPRVLQGHIFYILSRQSSGRNHIKAGVCVEDMVAPEMAIPVPAVSVFCFAPRKVVRAVVSV